MSNYKKRWQHFEINERGKDYVCGDIHGYFDLVKMKMIELKFDKNIDRLFSLGDLIDRGPYSDKAIEWIKEPWFFAIKGNHEDMIREYHLDISWHHSYATHGGQWFIDLPYEEREKHVDILHKLPDVFEIDTINGKIGMVHAEVPVHDWLEFKLNYPKYEEQSKWSFDILNDSMVMGKSFSVDYIDYVIHGHSSVKQPTKFANKIYIDTGAYSHKLTFLEINHPEGLKAHH